jgi:ATP-dependent Clp protease adaptor protein ClpS|tara:strand:+ start:2736 stop:3035 length:300 start_codon:yes stop_codon:yes gene_type:complete
MSTEQTSTKTTTTVAYPDRFNVIIFNDDFTPMDFVIQLLIEIFNRNLDEAKDITLTIHEKGQAIAGTYMHELAEQKLSEAIMTTRTQGHPLKITMEKMS